MPSQPVWECRLVLGSGAETLAHCELRDYRQAVTAIAPFVRQCAGGVSCEVRLEVAEGVAWRVAERWGPDVVGRILGQAAREPGVHEQVLCPPNPHAPSRKANFPRVLGRDHGRARPVGLRPSATDRRRTHHWHVGTTLAVAAAGWALVAVYLTGGRPLRLFEQGAKASMVQPSELPFHRPKLAVPEGVPQFNRPLPEIPELASGSSPAEPA